MTDELTRKRKRKKRKNKTKLKPTHYIIIFLFVYVLIVSIHQRILTNGLLAKKEARRIEIETLETNISELEHQIEISDTLEFVEKVAREDYNMVRPREIIYVDIDKANLKERIKKP